MSTKNNPGPFNYYAMAAPDEPMFVLLARDEMASQLVRLWAEKLLAEGAELETVKEAFNCARAMDLWRVTRERNPHDET